MSTPTRAPVLILGFNRPNALARIIEAVSAVGPREVFVAIDGPRADRPDDDALCAQARSVAENIDWATPLHLRMPESNQGCGPAVSAAISWAFEHVSELIILEDDCLPDPSFLHLCDTLLPEYRDDTRVMQIGGSNWGAAPGRFGDYSYAFTSFSPIWGWATWRRAWALYDFELETWPRMKRSGLAQGMSVSPRFRRMLARDWEQVRAGNGTWDHQWQYTILRHHGLNICPARNLVQNIGMVGDGTQLQQSDRILSQVPLQTLEFPLTEPPEVARSASVESVFEQIYWQKLGWLARTYRLLVQLPGVGKLLRNVAHAVIPRPA